MKKILITGATGFAGSHLVDHLIKKSESDIFGIYLHEDSQSVLGANKDKIKWFQADLKKEEEIQRIISEIKPDSLYHLAAFASPADSFSSPNEAIVNNITSQLNVLEAIRKNNLTNTKVLIVSSGDVYGNVDKNNLPINEDVPFNPNNPYAISKLAQDFLGKQYFTSYGLNIIRVRPFNHIGPRQAPNFVVSSFAKQIAQIEKGKTEPVIKVGNLDAKRDFTDVRDIVKAYALLLEMGEPGEVYNIGSGNSHKISEVLSFFLSKAKLEIKSEIDPKKLRPSDIPDFICDYTKLNKLTGWKPEISFEKSLTDILNYWREKV